MRPYFLVLRMKSSLTWFSSYFSFFFLQSLRKNIHSEAYVGILLCVQDYRINAGMDQFWLVSTSYDLIVCERFCTLYSAVNPWIRWNFVLLDNRLTSALCTVQWSGNGLCVPTTTWQPPISQPSPPCCAPQGRRVLAQARPLHPPHTLSRQLRPCHGCAHVAAVVRLTPSGSSTSCASSHKELLIRRCAHPWRPAGSTTPTRSWTTTWLAPSNLSTAPSGSSSPPASLSST